MDNSGPRPPVTPTPGPGAQRDRDAGIQDRWERRLWVCAAILAGAVAVLVRVLFLDRKPFWRDEAWVAWLVETPPSAVGSSPPIPAGFLAMLRALAEVLPGPPEVTYRLLPLAASLAAVALLPALGRRLGAGPHAMLAALWLAAGIPAFVYCAREVKPYALDLMFATLVPLVVARLAFAEGRSWRAWALLATLLLLVPWLSFGALFPLAVSLVWAAARAVRRHGWRALGRWALPPLLLALVMGLVYTAALRGQLTDPFLRQIWRAELTAPSASPAAALHTLWQVHHVSLSYLFPGVWPMVLALALLGMWWWPPPGRSLLLALWLGGALMGALAAVLGNYIVAEGRFLLFLAPPVVLFAAHGLARIRAWPGVAVAAVLGVTWSVEAVVHRLRPVRSDPARYFLFDAVHDVEPLIARLAAEGVPPRGVLVSRHAAYPFLYYSRGRLAGAFVTGILERDFAVTLQRWLPTLGGGLGWLLLLDEEAEGGRRRVLIDQGYAVEEVQASRGARLWRVSRSSPPRTR